MSRIRASIVTAGMLAAGALFVGGCGGPPGAGTVNMSAIKAAAAQRGIPEAKKAPDVAKSGVNPSPGRARKSAPTRPLPKGGR
jgi:hypothetical protein